MDRRQQILPPLRLALVALACAASAHVCAAAAPHVDERIGADVGFAEGKVGEQPREWLLTMAGWSAQRVEERGPSGAHAVRMARDAAAGADGSGILMRTVRPDGLQGRAVSLTAQVRVVGHGTAQMWLRVDRANGAIGAFDNMGDRPIRSPDWREARIDALIDADAQTINIGFMAFGGATLMIDDVRLVPQERQDGDEPRPLAGRALENVVAASRLVSYLRFFHPSDECVGVASWDHVALALVEAAEPATDADDLVTRLLHAIDRLAPTVEIWAGSVADAPDAPPVPAETVTVNVWSHRGAGRIGGLGPDGLYRSVVLRHPIDALPESIDVSPVVVELGGGVAMRLAVAVPADEVGTIPHGQTPPRWHGGVFLTTDNRATRLASVALAWGVFQHFYPYFDVIAEQFGVDWDGLLVTTLAAAAEADGAAAHTEVLSTMVAALHDGHGRVRGSAPPPSTAMPVGVEWAGDDLVVVAVADAARDLVAVGDALVAIDGRPIEECHADMAQFVSAGTEGWRRSMTASMIAHLLPTEDPVTLTVRAVDGSTRTVEVARSAGSVHSQRTRGRIANGAEIDPAGIVYFDLRGTTADQLVGSIRELARAKALVFDVRGYPDSAAYRLLGHLTAAPMQSARWMVPIVHRPDRVGWTWDESGRWNLAPLVPRLDQPIAFLTDGSAISYAESIMGIVEHYRLGEIVGAPTAGANGNVNPFRLPGGDTISWTGMKVLKHDGSRHHALGILPTVAVEPTQRGIAEGRDEVLERAIEVLKARLAESRDGAG